jgi:hypothetical protein
MRKLLVLSVLLVAFTSAARGSSAEVVLDDAALLQLEQRADHADPKQQAFLYTELAHLYTLAAGKEIASGEMERASSSIHHIRHYAELIHAELSADAHKLKNLQKAEMLMHETTFHLGEYLRLLSSDDKAEAQLALKQLEKVNDELLAQVFAH